MTDITLSRQLPALPGFFTQRLGLVAVQLLLPAILTAITIGNQLWMVGPFYVGQFFFWFGLVLSAIIVLDAFRGAIWPYFWLMAVPIVRLLDAIVGSGATTLLYFVVVNGLFFMAALVAALEHPTLIYKQVRFFLLLSLPLMFLQTAGAGSWTQALNTEYWITEADIGAPKIVHWMMFEPLEQVELNYNVGQGRPAGFLHANNVLSLVIIFGFALQFGRVTRGRPTWTDALLVGCMVFAMAKIVIFTVLFMLLFMFFSRDAARRARAAGVLLLSFIGYALYALLFPGMFELQLSAYKIMYSFSVRIVDLLETFSALDDTQRSLLLNAVGDTPSYDYASDEDVGSLSGYATLLEMWPLMIAALLIMTPLFFAGLARAKRHSAAISATAFACAITVVLYVAAVPFFRAQLYWFVFGFAAVPFFTLVMPERAARLIARGRDGSWGAR